MSLDPRATRDTEKTASRGAPDAPGRPIAWPDVLRVLPTDETRSCALRLYRGLGFSADAFGARRAPREAMAEALTRTEDHLELVHPRREAEREAIRTVRRRLERELWP